ncbi:SGNH/GDSL hydrolase family protein [Candidatus Sumerlaeota bacterium]|nr:SGNH/GDSL hydrolase family protein [Candidatus Sumerlaeota bacterium]
MQTPPAPTTRASLGIRKILLVLSCAVLVLAVGEMAAQLLLPPARTGAGNMFILDHVVGWRYPAHSVEKGRKWFGTMHDDLVFETNNRGLKGARDYPAPREKNEIRILCLGDSSTNYLHFDAYPEFMERQLSEAFPEKKFRVQNAGIAGFSSENVKNLAKVELPLFQPDFVVVLVGTCDAARAPIRDSQKGGVREFGDLIALVGQYSRLITAIRDSLPSWMVRSYIATPNRDKNGRDGVRCTPEEYRHNLESISHRAKKQGAFTLISGVTWLYPLPGSEAGGDRAWAPIRDYQEVIRSLQADDARKADASRIIVDPARQLFDRPDRAAFFAWIEGAPGSNVPALLDNGHLNLAGNEYLAAFYAKQLAPVIRERFGRTQYDPGPMNRVLSRYKEPPSFDPTYLKFTPPEDEWHKVTPQAMGLKAKTETSAVAAPSP